MTLTTLRPNADWNNASVFTISGGLGSVHASLADNSDSTFITRSSNTIPASYETEFATTSIGATEKVISVNLRARIVVGTAGNAQFSLGVITDRNGRTVYYSVPITKQNTLALTTVDIALNLTSAPNGQVWTQTLIDNLVFKFTDNAVASADKTTLYAVYVDVLTTAQPTLTVTSPSGTVSDTSFPSVVWSYSDVDGDPQSAYEIKIFDSTTYGGAGFSANTSTPIVETGVVVSSNNGQTLEADLANSTTYRAYVRVAQLLNGDNYFSAYAFSQFSLAVNAPASPTVSAFYDAPTGAVTVTVLGRTNVLSINQASLETNTDGWVALTNCSVGRTASHGSDGTASLSLTASGSGDMVATTTTATAFIVTPNTKFSATAEFKANSTGRSTATGIVFRNGAGTTLSTVFGTAEADSSSAFNQCVVSATAPATAVTALVAVKIVSAGASEIHFVDKIAFHAGDEPFWTRGGFSNFSFDVERSDGTNGYLPVRNSPVTASSAQIASVTDFEVPLDETVTYRAKARAEI